MRIIKSVAPDLSVCLTNDNRLVIMIDNADGEHLAEVTSPTRLIDTLRELSVETVFPEHHKPGPLTTAEAQLNG